MRLSDQVLLLGAALGPAVAGSVWLVLCRWGWLRRAVAGTVFVAAHAAAWAVFWRLYGGTRITSGGLEPSLLQASIVAVAEVGVLLVLVRAEMLPQRPAIGAVLALSVSISAVAYAGYSDGLIAQALLVPAPTLAALGASLAGSERPGIAWFGGLAVADLVAVTGLAVLVQESGSSLITPTDGLHLGSALLLVAAAMKAGAVPEVATWRLTASGGPAALLTPALRGQGMMLLALGGPAIAGFDENIAVAAAAAGAAFLSGAAAVVAVRAHSALASLCGIGAALPFLALGLGGSVGVRAYLVLFPAFLLASGAALLLGWSGGKEQVAGRRSRLRRSVGAASLGVAAASLLGFLPAGGFPGTWLALQLAAARADAEPFYVVLSVAVTMGLAAAAVAAIPLVRGARPRATAALLGASAGALLLYIGSVPVRIGAGWWVRVERQIGVPELLSFVGAPHLPPVEFGSLLGAVASVTVPIVMIVVLGRGFRDAAGRFAPLLRRGARRRDSRLLSLGRRVRQAGHRFFVGLIVGSLIELGAVAVVVWLVVFAGRRGFL